MPQNTILNTTKNLISLYCHLPGETEVPLAFHTWACMSLIAACVEDRVWIEKHPGKKLSPILYVFLIGPPALGKGNAIDMAFDFYLKCQGGGKFWHGSTTAANFKDVLGKTGVNETTGQEYSPQPKIWLITDELADDIGMGKDADTFIKLMTKLYTSTGTVMNTGTRTSGWVQIEYPAVNWLAGTTEDWYVEAVGKNIVGSGFSSRVIHVFADYHNRRLRRQRLPNDYIQVRDHVLTRLWLLSKKEGKFVMTPEAEALEDTWYMNRLQPLDKDLLPNWKREQDQILKLAMILSLADEGPLVIEEHHMRRAMAMSKSVQANIPKIVALSNKDPQLALLKKFEDIMQRVGKIGHQELRKMCHLKGINKDRMQKYLYECMGEYLIVVDSELPEGGVGRPKTVYKWVGDKK